MKTYVVGGAVRDRLLGLPVQDRDHVVVGATPDALIAAGYTPVGRDFPVFLHPRTHEEYALARTERKTARGYAGFAFHAAPDVTLEQDLARRDLTINAIAEGEDGQLIDPYGGQRDLALRVFRHVGPAFVEDPVRILRVARFAARFTDFSLAPDTLQLMRDMVNGGEVDALVAERVWQELARGLMEARPSRMFAVLDDCGALARILPEFSTAPAAVRDAALAAVDQAARDGLTLTARFALLAGGLGAAAIQALCARLRVPNEARDLALLVAHELAALRAALTLDARSLTALLERADAFRRPARFAELLQVALTGGASAEAVSVLRTVLRAAAGIDAGAIARGAANSGVRDAIPDAIRAARVQAVASALLAR